MAYEWPYSEDLDTPIPFVPTISDEEMHVFEHLAEVLTDACYAFMETDLWTPGDIFPRFLAPYLAGWLIGNPIFEWSVAHGS